MHKLVRFGRLAIFASALLAVAQYKCWSQTATSQLSGSVYDNSHAVITGASVTATNESTGVTQKQLTTDAGLYSFPSLPVGSYSVTV